MDWWQESCQWKSRAKPVTALSATSPRAGNRRTDYKERKDLHAATQVRRGPGFTEASRGPVGAYRVRCKTGPAASPCKYSVMRCSICGGNDGAGATI